MKEWKKDIILFVIEVTLVFGSFLVWCFTPPPYDRYLIPVFIVAVIALGISLEVFFETRKKGKEQTRKTND